MKPGKIEKKSKLLRKLLAQSRVATSSTRGGGSIRALKRNIARAQAGR